MQEFPNRTTNRGDNAGLLHVDSGQRENSAGTKLLLDKTKHRTHVVSTIATASLSIDSPNTNMYSNGSTLSAWKMASVATGSTADMSAPKANA